MFGKKTGGRAKGVPNKGRMKRQREIAASGMLPLDYMIAVMRDENQPTARRDEMARASAPYLHPKLVSKDVNLTADVSENFARLWSLISGGTDTGVAMGLVQEPGQSSTVRH